MPSFGQLEQQARAFVESTPDTEAGQLVHGLATLVKDLADELTRLERKVQQVEQLSNFALQEARSK